MLYTSDAIDYFTKFYLPISGKLTKPRFEESSSGRGGGNYHRLARGEVDIFTAPAQNANESNKSLVLCPHHWQVDGYYSQYDIALILLLFECGYEIYYFTSGVPYQLSSTHQFCDISKKIEGHTLEEANDLLNQNGYNMFWSSKNGHII